MDADKFSMAEEKYMKLIGQQYKQLQDALLDAFPSQQKLAQVVQFRLEKNLNAVAMGL